MFISRVTVREFACQEVLSDNSLNQRLFFSCKYLFVLLNEAIYIFLIKNGVKLVVLKFLSSSNTLVVFVLKHILKNTSVMPTPQDKVEY